MTKRKKLQVVISSHSPILIKDMPAEAIKLYVTNSQGKFVIKENVDYREVFRSGDKTFGQGFYKDE